MFGQQQFGQQQFGQQQFTGRFNSPPGCSNNNTMNQQPPWLMALGGSPAAFNFSSSPQSPAAASNYSSFSGFSSHASNTPNTSYASSPCPSDSRGGSPYPPFAAVIQATELGPATPSHGTQPMGLPTPPASQQPGSRFLPDPSTPSQGSQQPIGLPTPPASQQQPGRFLPTFTRCAQCTTPLPASPRRLSCGHATCPPCTRRLIIQSLSNAARGAPFAEARCCAAVAVPLAVAGTVLSHAEFTAYRERLVEQARPPAERKYCHDPRCGMLLRRDRPQSGTCGLCGDRTCTRCGRRAHRVPCARKGAQVGVW